ncbi:MAG: AAA family ATPase [Bacteroidetes bacterium]|nr:AAA family ATPase [Bacteroidota bacterium]
MDSDQIYIPRPDIHAQFDRVCARTAEEGLQVIWFFGETGQGKTWFLRNYLDHVRQEILVSYAQCSSPLGSQSTNVLKPHQPLKDIFEDLLANQANTRRKLNLIKNISLTVLAIIPIVGDLAYGVKEIRRDLNEFKSGKREVDFSNFIREYFGDLKRIAEETPVLVVIDDVQWTDVHTIEALHRFFADPIYRSARVTVVLSARRDELESAPEMLSLYTQFSQEPISTEIILPPFDSGQIRDFFRTRFPHSPPQPDLLLWLEQKTGGNPFFLQSYIQHLLVEDVLDPRGTVMGDLESYRGLPAEIRLVTNWLMKSLQDEDLTLLLTASVLGFHFSLHELTHLTRRPTLELIRGLRRIRTKHGIVEPAGFRLINGRESTVYRFTQHAIHTALYNELTAEEKEALHRMTAHYLNELRLARSSDPDVQNSIASALMLHSRLGREPELEYQSILMKAQNTAEDLNEDEIMEQLRGLSPALGLPIEQIMETYRQAMQLAPLHTRHAGREQLVLSIPQEEREGDSLGQFLARVLAMLRRENTSEAHVLLEMQISSARRRGQLHHPILHILYALTSQMLGRDMEQALLSLHTAAQSPVHPTYAAFARLGLALFEDDDDEATLGALREAAAYSGRHRGIVHSIVAWVIQTRFAGREEFAAILEQHPLLVRPSEMLQQHYPKTAAVLRKR